MPKVSDPDRVAAVATAVGVGLIALMITWVLGNRLIELMWSPPVGPVVSLSLAVAAGVATSVVAARKLVRATGANRSLTPPSVAVRRPRREPRSPRRRSGPMP